MGRSLIQRGPTGCGGVSKAGITLATLLTPHRQVQSPASERTESKIAMPIRHRNEKAG